MNNDPNQRDRKPSIALPGPAVNPAFEQSLDHLVTLAKKGQRTDSPLFNPSQEWLLDHIKVFQDLTSEERENVLEEVSEVIKEAEAANAQGKAAAKVWPETVVRLDNGGLAFFSQLGVVRRPDLTQYFIDGFSQNRDALAFSEDSQALFAEVLSVLTQEMEQLFESGEGILQTDRRICDAPGRSFHARQVLLGTRYLQLPLMWRHLTFDLPEEEYTDEPDIMEVSIPNWLEDLGLSESLKDRIKAAGLTQLVFKAPTKGLSLHLGFDYVGEHKMGPLSIAMFKVKEAKGLAIQAALSMVRIRTLEGKLTNSAIVTLGPSLHGKSTLTIMIELAGSEMSGLLGLKTDPAEGVYPMNDDIVLLQHLPKAIKTVRDGKPVSIPYGIDGTENNLYAVPFGLTREDDPITYDVLRGTPESPNPLELLENVPVDIDSSKPRYDQNPVRNMRMILSRQRLLDYKGSRHVLADITGGQTDNSVHVPMENTDRVFWQAVMRQNTIIAPLRKLTLEQYIRVLMYGEAVQMGAAIGAIGKPYVEYFSDPFIIGLEDNNANMMYTVLKEMANGGLPQYYYVFNTGGVGAASNEEASGPNYKKIPRSLTLTLQEALLREAVIFEYDPIIGSDTAVAVVNAQGEEVLNLRQEWLPRNIYGEEEYGRRIDELRQRRFYGIDENDKAGILRYTKVVNTLLDLREIPAPMNERELAWLLSYCWHVDHAHSSLSDLAAHLDQGTPPENEIRKDLSAKYRDGLERGLRLTDEARKSLAKLAIS